MAHDNATPAHLLEWVSQQPCLAALVQDPPRALEWAEDAAGGLTMAGARAEDVSAAIAEFVTERGQQARRMGREELVRELGRYLKRAKAHGDSSRSRRRGAADRAPGSPAAPGGGRPIVQAPQPAVTAEELAEARRDLGLEEGESN